MNVRAEPSRDVVERLQERWLALTVNCDQVERGGVGFDLSRGIRLPQGAQLALDAGE
ncbi:MAG: hypothetical protein IPI67_35670 [Myxococcales bacterium]|nr:hypothetical protein [Myxococcales bacterium]